ncbi:uncharacterized protein METZ01_LOCUS123940 [marine metagenome]|uniref:Uncharacterized protein n=1 Tax=marine metagenome TaxID=408172 RepID=A0A381Y1X2_9ZZZZ
MMKPSLNLKSRKTKHTYGLKSFIPLAIVTYFIQALSSITHTED